MKCEGNIKMLNSIRLINFRSWKDSLIEFHPGVNVITGENDSGKTNILRGINWVANNRPTGEDLRSYWGGDTISQLAVNNKDTTQTVERFRSDSENLYRIVGQKEPFKSFKQGVPEAVAKVLNFSPTNIQFQLEGPFLLGQSPPDVAKHYNDAVNLEIIDRSISNIAKMLRDEKGNRTKLKADQESQIEKLKAFDWLPEAEEQLVKLEKMQVVIRRLELEYASLSGMATDLKTRSEEYDKLNEVAKHEKATNALLKLNEQIDIEVDEHNELESLIDKLQSLKEQSEKFEEMLQQKKFADKLIHQAKQIDAKRGEFLELEGLGKGLVALEHRISKYATVLKFESKANSLSELDKQIDAKTGEYNDLFDLVKQQGKLNENLEVINKQRAGFEAEFKKSLPEMCPIFDVPCEYLKGERL